MECTRVCRPLMVNQARVFYLIDLMDMVACDAISRENLKRAAQAKSKL